MNEKKFLKLKSIKGGSKSPRHTGSIEIESFTINGRHHAAVGSGSAGHRATINDLTIVKAPDISSKLLWIACHSGENLGDGVLTIEQVSETGGLLKAMIFTLKSIYIHAVSAAEEFEMLELNVQKLEMELV